jgi:diguanylate cyclase (GGDEF)-like protein
VSGALVVLAVNIAAGSLFAAGYAIFALADRTHRSALGFSAGYLIGMLSPLSDFLVPFVGFPAFFEAVSYGSFLVALLSISVTLNLFYRRGAPWSPIIAILIFGMVLRMVIWSLQRDTILYGMAYQIPFMAASILGMRTALNVDGYRPLNRLLAGIFGAIAIHFLAKPFLAASLGSGKTLADYTNSNYALLSQASTGILLLAAGLALMLVVAYKAIAGAHAASEIDSLSGLANRRGFNRQAEQLMRSTGWDQPISATFFDLDHFKKVNDTFGHEIGDLVIAGFGALLREHVPPGTLIARLGGEEFAMLGAVPVQTAWQHAEAIRTRAESSTYENRPAPTVSGGIAQQLPGESLSDLLRRADQASYQAKKEGRNRICRATDKSPPERRSTFATLRESRT